MRTWITAVATCGIALGLAACSAGKPGATDSGNVAAARSSNPAVAPVASRGGAPAIDWAAMQRFWDGAIKLPGIDTGPADSSKRMIVMFDPNCPACARQWQVLKPFLDTIRIHWVPVGYLRPDSTRKAAAILSAANPVEALTWNEDHYDFAHESGGLLVPMAVPAIAIAAVKTNTASDAFNQPIAATPIVGFEFDKGHRYWRKAGMVTAEQMPMVLTELGNNPDPYARTRELLHRDRR